MSTSCNTFMSLLLAASFAVAQQDESTSEIGSALYFHPVSTALLSAAGIPTVYITYEKELGTNTSWTLQPLFGMGSYENSEFEPDTDILQVGAVTTYRMYRGDEPQGWYLAPGAALCYMYLKQKSNGFGWTATPERSGSATQFGVLGYAGYRSRKESRFTWFWDIGAGFQSIATTGDVEANQSSGLLIDMNIGLGFRL